MADGQMPVAQRFQCLGGENLRHQAVVLVALDQAVVAHRDAAAHLAAVLQGVQRKIGGSGHVLVVPLGIDAEYAALLVQLAKLLHVSSFRMAGNRD